MKVVHITTHLGGGVGRVVLSWLEHAGGDPSVRHEVYCLDTTNEASGRWASRSSIPLRLEMAKNRSGLREAVSGADIVLVHWWNHPILYDLLVNAPLPECRLLLWSHVSGHTAPNIFSKGLIEFSDRFILASPYSYEAPAIRALDQAFLDNRVRLVFTCAGTERGERARPFPHGNFTVGYIGTVDYCKMHPSFIRMSAAARIPGVRFVVCGGDRHEEILGQARRIGAADAFRFTGPVEAVTDQLGTFDVFGYPLRQGHYGTGEQALIEAMAAGLPAVVFDNGCERCIIENNETGFIVKSEDEYTAALELLYRDEPLRKRLGGRARERAKERFSIDATIAAWNDIFLEAVKLEKRYHRWGTPGPLRGARLFVESLGEAGKEFEASMRGGEDAAEAEARIPALTGAHRAPTRGSAFHYRNYYPGDPFLNRWCNLLEKGSCKSGLQPRKITGRMPCGTECR